MFSALNGGGLITWASQRTDKSHGPFRCPDCNEAVVFKQYADRRSHFAHRADSVCGYDGGETETHRYCKENIAHALATHPDCTECHVEFRHYSRQPDIFANIKGQWVAIEIQNSDIPLAEVRDKIAYYYSQGINVLYVLPHSIPGDGSTMPLTEWQRYLHAMYRDNLYYWFDKDLVALVHLGSYKADGLQTRNAAFYTQRRPVFRYGRYVSITTFASMRRRDEEVLNRHVGITDALLWQNGLGNWWKNE
jgi:competence protein CoiA